MDAVAKSDGNDDNVLMYNEHEQRTWYFKGRLNNVIKNCTIGVGWLP